MKTRLLVLLAFMLVSAKVWSQTYIQLSFSGPTQVCADNTTLYTYTATNYGGGTNLNWTVSGGTAYDYPATNQVRIKWSSSTGYFTAALTVESCQEVPVYWPDIIPPEIWYYETQCTYTYYYTGSNYNVTSYYPALYTVSGGGGYCGTASSVISLGGSQTGYNYQLKLNGSNVGTAVSGTGSTLNWANQTGAGSYTIVATHSSVGCSRTMTGSATVTINPLPTAYSVTVNGSGSASICTGQAGLTVNLSGSQTGINYQLKLNGANSGSPVAGTGAALNWTGNSAGGTYTVVATNATTTCSQTMTGSAVFTVNPLPTAFTVQGGGTYCAGGTGPGVILSSSQSGVNYQLKVNGSNSGSPKAGTGSPLTWSNQTAVGSYTVSATNASTGCTASMTGSVSVSVGSGPSQFTVSGGGSICTGATGMIINLSGSQTGTNYQLKVNGNNSGAAIAGTGYAISWSNQTTAGTYTVVATDAGGSCSANMIANAAVTVNSLPTAFTVGGGTCNGGIGVSITLSNSTATVKYQLKLDGVENGLPVKGTGAGITWANQGGQGSYTATAVDTVTHCTNTMSGSISVTSSTLPGASITGPNVLSGDPITIYGSTGAGYSWAWKKDDVTISGQTSSTLSVNQTGNYQLVVTRSGCQQISAPFIVRNELKPLYNGLIGAMRWHTDKAYSTADTDYEGQYQFQYDEKYQILAAFWSKPNFSNGSFALESKFRLSGMSYDPNGNIMSLKRYGSAGTLTDNFSYHYTANTNKLTKVDGYTNYYGYNAIGQMISANKSQGEDQYVEYDVSGKVTRVFSDSARTQLKVTYKYDDRGFRLVKRNHSVNPVVETWYIRDASGNVLYTYEKKGSAAPVLIEVPVYGSGKLGVYYPALAGSGLSPDSAAVSAGSMSYELTDHLGNVRAIMQKKVTHYIATLEDNGQATITNPRVQENGIFKNLFETEKVDYRMNHTAANATTVTTPERSAYLYWVSGISGQEAINKSIGPAINLRVQAGDKLDISAWVKYEKKASYTRGMPQSLLATVLGGTFAFTTGMESVPLAVSTFNSGLPTFMGITSGDGDTRPFAYINYMLFNSSFTIVDAGAIRVPTTAGFDPGQEATSSPARVGFQPVTVSTTGYMYIWVSNETEATKVWFDDLKVSYTQDVVTQTTDYGPWGDIVREQRSNVLDEYRYGYQGQYSEHDDETNWNHYEAREYDPIIGRWLVPDPAREFWSPYVSMGNDPINSIDPDGRDRIHTNSATGETFVEETGFWSFDWLVGDKVINYTQEQWDQAGRFAYAWTDNGGPGHGMMIDKETGEGWEINHPKNANGEIEHGLISDLNGGPKSVGYYWENVYDKDSPFWTLKERGDLHLANVFIPNRAKAVNYFNSFVGKSYPYDLLSNNCKSFCINGLIKGGVDIRVYDVHPGTWTGGFSTTIQNPLNK